MAAAGIPIFAQAVESVVPYFGYHVMHIIGLVTLFAAAGGTCILYAYGDPERQSMGRKSCLIMHGIGGVLSITGAFGLMTAIHIPHVSIYPAWIWIKLLAWLWVGLIPLIVRKKPKYAIHCFNTLPVIAGIALTALWWLHRGGVG